MEYNILSSTPYETVEKEDKSLAPGTRKQEQNGYTGYKVATYRCVYDKNGKLVSRTLEANSTYKSRNQIILVGPAQENTSGTGEDQETETTPSVPETGGGGTAAPETPAPDDTAGQSDGRSCAVTLQQKKTAKVCQKPRSFLRGFCALCAKASKSAGKRRFFPILLLKKFLQIDIMNLSIGRGFDASVRCGR